MKNRYRKLHMDHKRALILMLVFALVLSVLSFITILSVKDDCAQLYSLLKSDYIFSAITTNPSLQDDYYQFNAGIGYMISSDANTSINAEVVMQSNGSQYTDLVAWNADTLSTYGVAISKGISRSYGLNVGDKLYSKHIVDGIVYEYTVEQILPDIINIRSSDKRNFGNGIIIMGFDERYVDNITHVNIVFTEDSVNEWSAKFSEIPENIIYRDDEIITVFKNLVPKFLLFILVEVLIVIGMVCLFTKEILYYFKRLVMLGFGRRELNYSYNRLIHGVVFLGIIFVFFVMAAASFALGFYPIEIGILFIMALLECAALFISACLFKGQLWR